MLAARDSIAAGQRKPGEFIASLVRGPTADDTPLASVDYLGDMPHTWVGAEYARALFGMLMHEEDERLDLLPGVPPSWVAGEGLRISGLPTAFGTLSMSARQEGTVMRVLLETGLRNSTPLEVDWPGRRRPVAVTVDGRGRVDYSADGIRLERPFRELVAHW